MTRARVGRTHHRACARPFRAALPLAILPALVALAFAATVHAGSLAVYGRLPRLENLALSPDGSRISFVRTEENDRLVVVYSLAEHTTLRGVRVGDHKLRSIQWADNEHLLLVTSMTTVPLGFVGPSSEWFQMHVYDVRSGKLYQVPGGDPIRGTDVMNVIHGRVMIRRANDRTMLFIPGLQKTSELAPALIRVDLDTHSSHLIRPGRVGSLGWIVDAAGEIAAEETYDQSNGHWRIFIRQDGHMREVASGSEPIEYPRLLGFGPTADTLLLQKVEEGDPVWRLLSLKDGSIGPPMAERKTLDEPIENRLTNRMVGGVHVGDSTEYVFFDPGLESAWNTVLNTFPGERVRLESASANFRKVIARVEGDRDGYVFSLVDLDAHRATVLGDVYDGVSKPYEVRRIDYAAGDGLRIPAYLTLPRGKPAKNLPLIVLPHGGPAARDTADFNWWVQALADQGYAVLQPNFRGSAVSSAFINKGFGEWGRRMQTDLSDGVRYVAGEGIADRARVGIVGGSYGGYAALAGVSLDPGVYRCAVSVAGIADLRSMLKWVNEVQRRNSNWTQRYWDRFIGVSGPDDPALDAISPIRHLDAIQVPVLLIHGRDDTVVPFEQSQVMYDALRQRKKDVQLLALKGEDHWLSRSGTRLQMLEASVAFLHACNPPD